MDKGVLEQMKPETSLEAKMTKRKLTERKMVGSWGVTLSPPHRPETETETQRGFDKGDTWGQTLQRDFDGEKHWGDAGAQAGNAPFPPTACWVRGRGDHV